MLVKRGIEIANLIIAVSISYLLSGIYVGIIACCYRYAIAQITCNINFMFSDLAAVIKGSGSTYSYVYVSLGESFAWM